MYHKTLLSLLGRLVGRQSGTKKCKKRVFVENVLVNMAWLASESVCGVVL